jgi:hypothetical protein
MSFEFDGSHVEMMAQELHETLLATVVALGQPAYSSWFDAVNWQKKSSYSTVEAILENPSTSTGIVYMIWVEERLSSGWVYGEETDKSNKIHNLLPKPGQTPQQRFLELPIEERIKDYVALGVVRDAMKRIQADAK